jgi:peptide/nickel transport system substrate-binding protein
MHNPGVRRYEYDLSRAKKLFAEAGWADNDGDGLLDRDGKKFSFTIMTNHGNEARRKTAVIIQQFFKNVGVTVDIREVEWAAFINEFIDKRKFEAVILGWSTGQDPDQYDIWHSSKTGEKELNFISYTNSEVDELLEKGRRTFDAEARKKYYWRFQEILAEEQPYNFLYVAEALPAIHARFKTISPAPAGIRYNFIEWYVPENEIRYSRF